MGWTSAQEQKIDLTKPYDPTKAAVPTGTEAKVEKLKKARKRSRPVAKSTTASGRRTR